MLVNVETGKEQVFSDARFDSGGQLAWLGDGSALVFDATDQYGGRWNSNSQLWSIAYPAGTLRRITHDVRQLCEPRRNRCRADAGGRAGRDARRSVGGA